MVGKSKTYHASAISTSKCLKSIFPLISSLKVNSMITDCLVKNKASRLTYLTPNFLQKEMDKNC